jgi:hypothetical protein
MRAGDEVKKERKSGRDRKGHLLMSLSREETWKLTSWGTGTTLWGAVSPGFICYLVLLIYCI